MYRAGLIVNIVFASLSIIPGFIFTIMGLLNVSVFSQMDWDGINNGVAQGLTTGIVIFYLIFGLLFMGISIASLVISIVSLKKADISKKMLPGIFGIFVGLIGGILVLVSKD